jgi:trimeric autotransporter adhesin
MLFLASPPALQTRQLAGYSLFSNTEGSFNTATGAGALLSNLADENTAFGAAALLFNASGFDNTATGAGALLNNDAGVGNTANGAFALSSNTGGQGNTATGVDALFSNTTANFNTANGFSALSSNTMGAGNTAIGSNALHFNTTGSGNIALGNNAGANVTTASDVTCIGSVGANVDNSCFIARIFGATSSAGIAVFINSDGRLGTTTSSWRFKEEITPMASASEALLELKPVTFRYKKEIDPQGIPQFGLVAEEVEKVNPDLVVRDKSGKPYSVRYDQVNAMLLNEFLKEHRKVAEQEATIAQLKKQMETVIARLQEHDSKIQRVSRPIGFSEAIAHTALSNP